MSAQKNKIQRSRRVLDTVFTSPVRVHVIGGGIAAVLIAGILWVAANPEYFCEETDYTRQELDDAISLVSMSEHWNERLKRATKIKESQQSRLQTIDAWLPDAIEWDDIRADLKADATKADLHLLSTQKGRQHTGERVSVLEAKVEVQGTFFDVCRFLDTLPKRTEPIWCSEAKLVRVKQTSPDPDDAGPDDVDAESVTCLASISLRIPFVGDAKAAKNLLPKEVKDAN